jgi:hypothetical protein
MELLDVDDDGSLLVAFYDGGRSVDYQAMDGIEAMELTAAQQPGIAVFTADGKEHVLSEPEPLDTDAVGEAVGSIHKGSVAVAWQVTEGVVDASGSVAWTRDTRTIELATGTSSGLTTIPLPTLDGKPVVVQWGGLHVVDGALVAYVLDPAASALGEQSVGLVDPATGEFTSVDEGLFLAPMRDLCDPAGHTFGYFTVDTDANHGVIHQFSLNADRTSDVRSVTPPTVFARSVPLNACGSDIAGVNRTTETLTWTEGSAPLSSARVGFPSGDIFLAPTWVAVHGFNYEEGNGRILIVDRATETSHFVSNNCARLVAAGDWIAFGYPDGDTCRPVAVRASELLAPS